MRIWGVSSGSLPILLMASLLACGGGGGVQPQPTPSAPVITSHPASHLVNAGQAATFTVAATGTPTPTYTWEFSFDGISWGNDPRINSPSYTLAAIDSLTFNGAQFRAKVTNSAGTATSNAAALTVVPIPSGMLDLPTFVHPGDSWMKASWPLEAGMTCSWSIIPGTASGTITAGQGTGSIGFSAGINEGTFQVQATLRNQAGDTATAVQTVTVQRGTWLVKNGNPSTPRAYAAVTKLPGGRFLVVGGVLEDSGGQVATAEIFDSATGTWRQTGSMGTARTGHTATLLRNGKVLVVGGTSGITATSSAEIYDPALGTWTPTDHMALARSGHTATLLQNGKVLVAGGLNGGYFSEIYDPNSRTWAVNGSMVDYGLYGHTATLLANGNVLVAGGHGPTPQINYYPYPTSSSARIFNPVTGDWTPTGSMGTARQWHTATLLPNGKVLAAGGHQQTPATIGLASAEIFDPGTGTWTPTGSLGMAREHHTATILPNGKVLVAGGTSFGAGLFTSTELYDPAAGTWSATGSLGSARVFHVTMQIQDGSVLVAGGFYPYPWSQYRANTERYDPATGTWTPAYGQGSAREGHTATLLPNGKVLVAGGNLGYSLALNSAELFDPATNAWTPTGSLGTSRTNQTATLLPNGKVLAVGGWEDTGGATAPTASAEIYDPSLGTWTPTGRMNTARAGHTATLLQGGKVLITGGDSSGVAPGASAEIYDTSSGTWSSTGSMGTARAGHTATLLPNGTVLVAGGWYSNAEVYTPATGTWTPTGSLGTARKDHASILLQSGDVLVVGGSNNSDPLATAEIYNFSSGTWTAAGSLSAARIGHTATLLPNGKVLVAGGYNQGILLPPIHVDETFDPLLGLWTTTGSHGTARYGHTATLLNDGTVMLAFGSEADVITEIYMP